MNFIKTQKLLTQQVGKTEIPLESVLDLMRTYLTELRHHTGKTADKCPIGDMDQTVANLAAVSNEIRFIYLTNEKTIRDSESRYTQSLDKAQSACAAYGERIAQLDRQIQQETENLKTLEDLEKAQSSRGAVLDGLRRQARELQDRIHALCPDDPDTETARLKNRIEESRKQLAQLEEMYQAMQQCYDDNQTQVHTLNDRLAKLAQDNEGAKQQILSLNNRCLEQHSLQDKQKQQRRNAEEQLRQLELDSEKASRELSDLLGQIRDAERALTQQNRDNAELEEKLAQRQSGLDLLQQDHSSILNREKALNARHTSLTEEIDRLRQKVRQLEQDNSDLLEACGRTRACIQSLAQEKDRLDADYQDALQRQALRQEEVENARNSIELLSRTIGQLDDTLADLNRNLQDLTAQYEEKDRQKEFLNTNYSELEVSLQQLREEISIRRQAIAAAEEALKDARTEADQLLEDQGRLDGELDIQRRDNQNFRRNQLEPAQAKFEELKKLLSQAKEDVFSLNASIQQLMKEHEDHDNGIKQLKSKENTLLKQLEKDRAENSQREQAVQELQEKLRIAGNASEALMKREKELRSWLDENNSAQIRENLERCNQQLEAQKRETENNEQTLREKRKQLSDLEAQYMAVRDKLADCLDRQKTLQSSYDSAHCQLEQVTCEKNRRRCEQLEKQLLLMQAMISRFSGPALIPCGDSFQLSQLLQEQLNQADQTLTSLRQVIRDYTHMRQEALETCD